MKKFEFVAGTSKDDIVMGLCLPVSIMLPALTTYLIIFYSEMYASFRSAPLLFRAFVFVPALYLTYFLIKKARKNAANKFVKLCKLLMAMSCFLDKTKILVALYSF